MFKKIKNYISDNEFKLNLFKDKINIVNYIDIIILEKERVTIKYSEGFIIVKGKELVLKKLLENEILITGNIKSIELE